jgi:nucleoside-diphosphate-sugar epimerase
VWGVRVLVTGANGYIGRAVIAALGERDVALVTAGRRAIKGVPFVETDLLSEPDFPEMVRRAQASHLVHLAWVADHPTYWTHPDNPRWAVATARLVDAFCQQGGKGVVVAGSCAEYDWSHGWCREGLTPSHPATPYGLAKDAARRLVQETARLAGVPLAWGRIFMSFGPGEHPDRLIPSLVSHLQGRRPALSVDGDAFRDYLHVDDIGKALVELLLCRAEGIVNISSGAPVRIRDIVACLAREIGADPEPLLLQAMVRPNEPRLLAGEPTRLTSLGWKPDLTLEVGLALCVGNWT